MLKSLSAERASVAHRDATGLAHAARGMLTQRDASVIETLPHIKAPSLVVVGADDTPFLAASDYMAAKIPGARKVVIPAAGHAANIDQPKLSTMRSWHSSPTSKAGRSGQRHEVQHCCHLAVARLGLLRAGAGSAASRWT